MKNILPLSLICLLLSCDGLPGRELPFTINNQTDGTISTVGIYTVQSVNGQDQLTDSVLTGSIQTGTNRVAMLNDHRLKRIDGGFRASMTDSTGVIRQFIFGYFSNGRFLDKGYTLTVKSDTVLIQPN